MHTIQQLAPSARNEIVVGVTLDAGAKGRGEYHHVHICAPLPGSLEHRFTCERCGDRCQGISLARALHQRNLLPAIAGPRA